METHDELWGHFLYLIDYSVHSALHMEPVGNTDPEVTLSFFGFTILSASLA